MKKTMIGYQVYSAREDAAKDLLGTLKALKAMGYDGVEFAGFYGHTAEEVKARLDEVGWWPFLITCPSPPCARTSIRSSATTRLSAASTSPFLSWTRKPVPAALALLP